MSVTADQQAALEKAVVREVYFCEFQFLSGTVYVCSFNQTITWNGHDWLGIGGLASIGTTTESDSIESSALEFGLNAAEQSWLALSVGSVEEYRGRTAKLYFCPLDENYQLIDEPVLCWRGIMDLVSVGIEGDSTEATGTIVLKCETSAYGIKRQPALRINPAQQKAKYPGDKALDYLPDLMANPQPWLSKKFQSI